MTTARTTRGKTRYALALLTGMALAAGAFAALADAPIAGFAPDPSQRASLQQWVFDVRVERGKPILLRAHSVTVEKAFATPRVIGRYAIELFVGPELLDRVRFNVPLTGDGPLEGADRRKKNPFHWPRFEDVTTRLRVQMADHPRAAYLAFVDRATGNVERFEWPPAADGQLVPIKRAQAGGAGSAAAAAAAKADAGSAPDGGGTQDAAPQDAGKDR